MQTATGKITLKLSSAFATIINVKKPSSLIPIDREISDGATIGTILRDLVREYPGLREMLLNPDQTDVSERIDVVLNRTLLKGNDIIGTKLHDGDMVFLLPVYEGG
jgi:molybdopterin converting factor small subunit